MIDTQERNLMMKFLIRNYPVRRLKFNKHFKRAIVTDDGHIHHLSNKESHKNLYFILLKTLKTVFYSDNELNQDVLKSFLHIK